MVRPIAVDMQEALSVDIRPAYFAELLFDVPLFLWSGLNNISWSGHTWLGNGWIEAFSSIQETDEVRATGMDLTLSGVPDSLLAIILNNARQANTANLYFASLTNAGQIVSDPILIFHGKYDFAEITDSVDESRVILKYETDLIKLDRRPEYRYLPESQKTLFPNETDRGFDYVSSIEDWSGYWGRVAGKPRKIKKRTNPKKNRR